MMIQYALLLTSFSLNALLLTSFVLITGGTAEAEIKVKGGSSIGIGTNRTEVLVQTKSLNGKVGGSESDFDDKTVDLLSKSKDRVSGSVEGIQNSALEKSNSSKQSKLNESHNVEASNVDKTGSKKEIDAKDREAVGSGTKGKNNEVFPAVRKENIRGEECGLPDRCTAEKDALVACLKVPGNESPDLSLLIQNKGKGPLDVKIAAPDFVSLEKVQIHLLENKFERVKVTVRNGGTDNLIILTAGNGNCTLSFKDLISQNFKKETVRTSQFNDSKYFSWTSVVAFIILTALLLLASVWTCISFRRRHFPSNSSKYQNLDTELPISNGTKVDPELNAGWDDNWGDSWDDEEAPKTPSMPITPSFSSQRVSSRQINKQGWKD